MKIASLAFLLLAAAFVIVLVVLDGHGSSEAASDAVSLTHPASAETIVPALSRTESRAIQTTPANATSSRERTREEPATITGVVMDEDGRPIADAHLFGHGVIAEDGRRFDTRSRADGTFALPPIDTLVANGSALLVVKEGFAPAELPVTEANRLREIVLSRGLSMRGHVRDTHGQPIEGAWVAWLPLCFIGCWGPMTFPFDAPRIGRTAADGSYQLDHLPDRVTLVATGPEHAADYGNRSAGGKVDFVLARVSTIGGEVSDAITGAPLEGVLVSGAVTTGADGRFVASANGWSFFEGATALFSFAKEGYAPARQSLERPQPSQIMRVRLYPLAHLRGRVLGVDGAPVARATVRTQCAAEDWPADQPAILLLEPGTTARDGSFAIDVAAGVAWSVLVTAPGMPEQTCARVETKPGEHLERELVVGAGRALRGVVRASESGTPIDSAGVGVAIMKEASGQNRLEYLARVNSDADGRFSFRGLSENSVWLIASGRGRARHAELVSLAATGELDVRLDEALTIEGDVVDPDGKPLVGARVRLRPEVPEPLRTAFGWESASADEHGHVRFPWLAARPYRLSIESLGLDGDRAGHDSILVEPPITNGRWVLRAR